MIYALLIATVPLWLLGIDAGLSHTRLGRAPLAGPLLGLGGVALLILSAATGEFSSLHLGQVSTRSWLALAYLIVIGSIVAFSAYGIAVRSLPTATVATYA